MYTPITVTHKLSIATEKEILRAERLQRKLYSKYYHVFISHCGIDKIIISALNPIR